MSEKTCPIEKQKKIDKKGGLVGILTGLLASLCCITPVVLILLGLGSASFAFSFIGLKPYFLVASILMLAVSFWFYFRKRKCGFLAGVKSPFVLTTLAVHLILFIGSLYLLLPMVGPYVFEKRLALSQDVAQHPPSCHLQLNIVSKSFNSLTCTSCQAALKYKLGQNPGVYTAEVDLGKSQALIHYNKEKVSSNQILKSVPSGFKIRNKTNQC